MKTTRDAIKLGNFTDLLSTYRTITYSKIIKIKALLFFQKLIIQFRHFCTMAHIILRLHLGSDLEMPAPFQGMNIQLN